MITNPSTEVALDEKHAKQLEVGLQKLSNVEAELAIATRNLRVLKDDIVKTTLEYKEIEGKVEMLNDVLLAKEEKNNSLDTSIASATEKLDKLIKENDELGVACEQKNKELSAREEAVTAREVEADSVEKTLKDELASLAIDMAEVEGVKKAFDEVTLPWK